MINEKEIRYVFDYFLNDKPKKRHLTGIDFYTIEFVRQCFVLDKENARRSYSFLYTNGKEYVTKSDDTIKKNLILQYIRMFYGKKPEIFKTDIFRFLCSEFNRLVASNKIINQKIKEIIQTGIIDLNDFSKNGILENVVSLNLKSSDISIDNESFKSVINYKKQKLKLVARIYINPSKQNYMDIYNYIMVECMKEEIPIYYKSRYTSDEADNLVLYIPQNCLGRVLKILNNYEKDNPEKIKSFLNPPLLLERNSHKWYGFGHELSLKKNSSGKTIARGTTLNEDVETMFARYIFPLLLLDNYGKIVSLSGKKDIRDKICSIMDDKDFDLKMSIGSSRRKIIQDKLDFKTKIREKMKEEKFENDDLDYIYWDLYMEKLPTLLMDVDIRKAFNDYFKKPENFEQAIKDIMYLINHYCEQIEYLGGGSIYTSKYLIEEKENNKKIILDFISLMHSKKYNYTEADNLLFEQELSEFLNKVGGLDNVILAFDYCEGIESLSKEELEYARQQINKLRKKRGIQIIRNKTPLSELSRLEIEDTSLDNINEIIYGNHSNDDKQYDIYRAFIDTHGDFLDEKLVSKLEESINKYIQNNFYKRKLLEYLHTKLKENKKIL